MNRVIIPLLTFALLAPTLASAHPGGWDRPGPGPGWHGDGPGRLSILPEAAAAVLIGGLTYYVLNGQYYQRQNDNSYVVVERPDAAIPNRTLDYNGQRYYVQDGHYYRRTIDGDYLEVPRPPGL